MQAARRLALAEGSVPYDALLGVLRTAYCTAQSQLQFASSRTKVPVQPVLRGLLQRGNLVEWQEELKDLMTVLGTASQVNRRRSMRALAKLQYLTVEEVRSLRPDHAFFLFYCLAHPTPWGGGGGGGGLLLACLLTVV